jgi:hypothetical protein
MTLQSPVTVLWPMHGAQAVTSFSKSSRLGAAKQSLNRYWNASQDAGRRVPAMRPTHPFAGRSNIEPAFLSWWWWSQSTNAIPQDGSLRTSSLHHITLTAAAQSAHTDSRGLHREEIQWIVQRT